MIKRTPQEIADFFGCYVVMDKSGRWYVYRNKPEIVEKDNVWDNLTGYCLYLDSYFIDTPANHDWHTFYEPAEKKKVKKLVPYDLSKKEDRDALRGKWVVWNYDGDEYLISKFHHDDIFMDGWAVVLHGGRDGEDLFKSYTFLDGSPGGKEVEE